MFPGFGKKGFAGNAVAQPVWNIEPIGFQRKMDDESVYIIAIFKLLKVLNDDYNEKENERKYN